jgi:hypothetical protein
MLGLAILITNALNLIKDIHRRNYVKKIVTTMCIILKACIQIYQLDGVVDGVVGVDGVVVEEGFGEDNE